MKLIKSNWVFIVIIILITVRMCEQEPEIITKVKYVPKVETIKETTIDTVYKKVYVQKTETIKGKDTIIYKNVPSETTISAKQYDAVVKTDSSRADLKITTTGELLDVQGTITYNQKETTITKIKPKSGLFLYLEGSLNNRDRTEIGLDYTLRNKYILGASASYNNLTKSVYVNAKLGIRIF